ncbi:MAG TPA: hypothetical protein VK808_10810, partial [Bacteroidia bacterium]|nr:hypothetical protein [Bacteroidia bacterium]
MKGIGKILRYLKNYKKYAFWNIFGNTFSILFGVFSISMLIPFLWVLFPSKDNPDKQVVFTSKPAFHLSGTWVSDITKYYMQLYSHEYGIQYVLIILCLFFVLVMLLKNAFRYL